jgi:hypothetical protein
MVYTSYAPLAAAMRESGYANRAIVTIDGGDEAAQDRVAHVLQAHLDNAGLHFPPVGILIWLATVVVLASLASYLPARGNTGHGARCADIRVRCLSTHHSTLLGRY